MGTRVAPTFAEIFVDKLIKECASNGNENWTYFFKCFIDDMLVIWTSKEDKFKLSWTKKTTLTQQ
jgi:hypothetical protein